MTRFIVDKLENDETFDADDIGKTVFLTRAEAENALGKEQNDGK